MNNNTPNKGLGGFLQRISFQSLTLFGVIISILSGLGGLIKLVRGDVGLVTISLLVLGIAFFVLIGIAIYIYLYHLPDPDAQTTAIFGKEPTLSERRKQERRRFHIGTLLILILIVPGFLIWQYVQNLPAKNTIVLVANFDEPDSKSSRVSDKIIEELQNSTSKYSDVKIQSLGETITLQEGSEVARAEGEKHKANIVIWGWYGNTGEKVPLSVHVELIRPSKYMPRLGQEAKGLVQVLDIKDLKSFTLQTRLAKQMTDLTLVTLGTIHYAAGAWDEAIIRFNDALAQTLVETSVLDKSFVYFYRGNAYYSKGDSSYALSDFNKVLELKPNFAEAYNNRAAIYFGRGNYELAITNLNKALELKPDFVEAYNNRGLGYFSIGNYDLAIADLNQALKIRPNYTIAYNNRGDVYISKGNYELAIADINHALELKHDFAEAYYSRGFAYFLKGNYNRAIADYNQALKFKPDFAEVYTLRGLTYFRQGEAKKGIIDLLTINLKKTLESTKN